MDQLHEELLSVIKKETKGNATISKHSSTYDGNEDKSYQLTNPQLRMITGVWLKHHNDLNLRKFTNLLNSLYRKSESSTEKYIAGFLLEYSPNLRKQLQPELLNSWLDNLVGWGQVDSLCQSRFGVDDMLHNWKNWKLLLEKLSESDNINKRRASLVLLTKPVRDSDDERFANLAIRNIEKLKQEREILITKAISWLLREMVKNHKAEVREYLNQKVDSLPRVAVKETERKIRTGRK